MAKLSVSVDVPLPPEKAWECASDLSRYKEWLSIHRVWRSKLPETLEKGTTLESIVEVKGMPNRIKWTIVHYKPPEAMTLNETPPLPPRRRGAAAWHPGRME